jgi:hypothetical protein
VSIAISVARDREKSLQRHGPQRDLHRDGRARRPFRPRHRLRRRDPDQAAGLVHAGIKNIKVSVANSTTYCIVNTVPGTVKYHKSGPGADIKSGSC